jgi:hypothetical protein
VKHLILLLRLKQKFCRENHDNSGSLLTVAKNVVTFAYQDERCAPLVRRDTIHRSAIARVCREQFRTVFNLAWCFADWCGEDALYCNFEWQ